MSQQVRRETKCCRGWKNPSRGYASLCSQPSEVEIKREHSIFICSNCRYICSHPRCALSTPTHCLYGLVAKPSPTYLLVYLKFFSVPNCVIPGKTLVLSGRRFPVRSCPAIEAVALTCSCQDADIIHGGFNSRTAADFITMSDCQCGCRNNETE